VSDFLIYGATGFTGRLVARAAVRRGLRPILAARRDGPLLQLAAELGLPSRVFSLEDPRRIEASLAGVSLVLHAAGPFVHTSPTMVEACIRRGVHYTDLTAEIDVFEALRARDAEARSRGVTLLPGIGHAVVCSDSLAAHVARRLPGATHLRIGVGGLARLSRGSTRALIDHAGEPARIRRAGRIEPLDHSLEREFDFGYAVRRAVAIGWADVATAHHSTGIPNIETYFEAIVPLRLMIAANQLFGDALRAPFAQRIMHAQSAFLPEGPGVDERTARRSVVVAEADDAAGRRVGARIFAPEVYASTAQAAVAVVERAMAGEIAPGFQTPSTALGPDFVLGLPGVVRQDVRSASPAARARPAGLVSGPPPGTS